MKRKILPWIIALSALSVSASAAFYSVSGLGKMFAGASLQVMILAGSLELAKLVTASLLYEYWEKLNKGLKYYLLIATFILIAITSAGIYGFLSSAYQETAFKVEKQDKNVGILDKKISILQSELSSYEKQVEQKNNRLTQITNIRSNLQGTQDQLIAQSRSTGAVRQQIKEIDSEIKRIDAEVSTLNDSVSSKNTQITNLETGKLNASSDEELAKEVGPLKYIAELTGKSLAQVVNWYIIVLMLVFDPLAIALVLAANFAFSKIKEEDTKIIEAKIEEIKIKEENLQEEYTQETPATTPISIKFKGESEAHLNISEMVKSREENIENPKEELEGIKDKYNEEDFGGYKIKNSEPTHITSQDTINPLSLR
jgi:archaellum component FlaC